MKTVVQPTCSHQSTQQAVMYTTTTEYRVDCATLWYMCVQKPTLNTHDGNYYKIHGDIEKQVVEVLLMLSSDYFF